MENANEIALLLKRKKERIKQLGIAEKLNYLLSDNKIGLPYWHSKKGNNYFLWEENLKKIVKIKSFTEKIEFRGMTGPPNESLEKELPSFLKCRKFKSYVIELDFCIFKFEISEETLFNSINANTVGTEVVVNETGLIYFKELVIAHNNLIVCTFSIEEENTHEGCSYKIYEPRSFLESGWLKDFEQFFKDVQNFRLEHEKLEHKYFSKSEESRLKRAFTITDNEIVKVKNSIKYRISSLFKKSDKI